MARDRHRTPWQWVHRALRAVLGFVFTGLVELGLAESGVPGRARLSEPPRRHPERLVPELPPTDAEQRLWAQFGKDRG
jgi:Family of unknown function (DUF6059)